MKRITASSRILGILALSTVIVLAFLSAVTLDYIQLRRYRAGVLSLRELTETQKSWIGALGEKIAQYERTLATLQGFDAEIRSLAREVNKKTRVALKPLPRWALKVRPWKTASTKCDLST